MSFSEKLKAHGDGHSMLEWRTPKFSISPPTDEFLSSSSSYCILIAVFYSPEFNVFYVGEDNCGWMLGMEGSGL